MSTPTTVNGIDELKALVGQTIGPSDWREVTQEDIDKFADATGDHQWIHVDVERAKTESPFGTTIAHGNLTLATIDGFRDQLLVSGGFKLGVNYGDSKLDKASGDDPNLVTDNKKATVGVYYSLTKNLMLLGEVSRTKSESDAGSNDATTVNVGAFLGF